MRVAAAVVFIALQGCAGLPSLDDRTTSHRFEDTNDSRLGRALQPQLRGRGGDSGLIKLAGGQDAFAARIHLADAADRSLDVQYYIWHNDLTGTLLLNALRRAADRGVRVRILLDDNNTSGEADQLSALAAYPNIQLRLFNPFAATLWRPLAWLSDFPRLNRRMHNKSFTADNQVSIVGGRNIGDDYFNADGDFAFVDVDVLAAGPVVKEVSEDFDRYWASDSAFPAERVLAPAERTRVADLEENARRLEMSRGAMDYKAAVANQDFSMQLLNGRLNFEWARTRLVSDDPAKGIGKAMEDEWIWAKLKKLAREPTTELAIVSPYFVPEASGVAYFVGLARRGVKVTIVTNSLEATDVPAVHSGYAKWRRALLEAGVELLEIKRSTGSRPPRTGLTGSSSNAALHGKAISIDRQQAFIGSFNFDPRSARLNTEMGLVIDSPEMAASVSEAVEGRLAALSYRLRLTDSGAIRWCEQSDGKEVVHDVEPGTTLLQRLGISFLSLLPIEWLL
jgi:putative cardiolipin synthase